MFQYEKDSLLKVTEELKTALRKEFFSMTLTTEEKRAFDMDYGDFEVIEKEKAEDSLNKAREFLIMAEGFLNELIKTLKK